MEKVSFSFFKTKWAKILVFVLLIAIVAIVFALRLKSKNPYDSTWKDQLSVGNTVTFGHYEQDNDLTNGKEQIEWIVLENNGEQVYLLSKYAIDTKEYNGWYTEVTWETCTLRQWLNSDFLDNAFDATEKKMLETVTVEAQKNPEERQTNPGYDTRDRVFLLSYREASRYLPTRNDRKLIPTAYAVAQDSEYSENLCWWWLRTPGYENDTAVSIDLWGEFENYQMVDAAYGIRPVIVLKL